MDQQAGLIINVDGKGKSYMLWNGTETYYEKLRLAYTDIKNDKTTAYSYFSFFTLCAATLEYSLNYIIADYCIMQYGPEKCKRFIDGFTTLNFTKKILMVPSIISNGQLIFNEDKTSFKKLNELVGLRNKIMHGKEYAIEIDLPNLKNAKEEEIRLEIKMKPNPIDTLDKKRCLEFADAIGDFKTYIMGPWFNRSMKENELLIKS